MIEKIIVNIPNPIKKLASYIFKIRYGFFGDYKTWISAAEDCGGYDEGQILEKVVKSIRKVRDGEMPFERDGVLFNKIQYSWPLLAGILFAAARSKDQKISVIDFGGSLGSTYFQNKKFLDRFSNVSWNVIEQNNFVKIGNDEFTTNTLKFCTNIQNIPESIKPNILVASGVLQYLEKPYEIIDELLSEFDFDVIVVDRQSFDSNGKERIVKQVVPPSIYKASYPCRLFAEKEFVKAFTDNGYEIVEDFDGADGFGKGYYFKGFIFCRENQE